MGNAVFIFLMGIVLMVIAAILYGRRTPTSRFNHDTTNASNFLYFGSDDSSGSDCSGDSGSCDSGDCGGGCDQYCIQGKLARDKKIPKTRLYFLRHYHTTWQYEIGVITKSRIQKIDHPSWSFLGRYLVNIWGFDRPTLKGWKPWFYWSERRDSNSRPLPPQRHVLVIT